MKNQILNIRGNVVIPNLDTSLFQEDGIIIYVEGHVLNEYTQDPKHRDHGVYSRQSFIDQKNFPPIKMITTFAQQGN